MQVVARGIQLCFPFRIKVILRFSKSCSLLISHSSFQLRCFAFVVLYCCEWSWSKFMRLTFNSILYRQQKSLSCLNYTRPCRHARTCYHMCTKCQDQTILCNPITCHLKKRKKQNRNAPHLSQTAVDSVLHCQLIKTS